MTRNHFVVALAAVGFGGLIGCGHAAVEVPVALPPPPAVVVAEPPPPPPPPAPRLATVCDAELMKAGHLKFPHEVEFDTGKASIKHTPTTDAILQCLVDFLNNNKMVTKFRVDGHTDNAGDATANMTLSQARADAILAWMTSHGVENGKLTSKGFGPTKPIAPNDSPEHMAQNRRVEFCIRGDQRGPGQQLHHHGGDEPARHGRHDRGARDRRCRPDGRRRRPDREGCRPDRRRSRSRRRSRRGRGSGRQAEEVTRATITRGGVHPISTRFLQGDKFNGS